MQGGVMDLELSQQELKRKLTDAGYNKLFLGVAGSQKQPVIKGDICFDTLPSGLRVHVTDTVENVSGEMVSEITPMLSINFLLEGTVCFSLDDSRYTFTSEAQPLTFVSLVTKTAIFKRYFKTGMKIKKLNITVDEHWLLARCKTEQDRLRVNRLFSSATGCSTWSCTQHAYKLINRLLDVRQQTSLTSTMEAEQIAFELFIDCYQQLEHKTQETTKPLKSTSSKVASKAKYEDTIDKLIGDSLTLDELSLKLGASISTLQRYFKKSHNVTLKQYIRNQKLEHARRRLIFDKQTIGEVSYGAGYHHPSNFIKAFRSYFSITPAELQKQYLHK